MAVVENVSLAAVANQRRCVVMQCTHFCILWNPCHFFRALRRVICDRRSSFHHKASWLSHRAYMVVIALLMLFLMRSRPECEVLGTASLAVLTIVIGVSFSDNLIRGRFDISYGVNLYAFPIQQVVINRVTGSFRAGMLIAAILTTMAAVLSYHLVEKRFLKRATHVRRPRPEPSRWQPASVLNQKFATSSLVLPRHCDDRSARWKQGCHRRIWSIGRFGIGVVSFDERGDVCPEGGCAAIDAAPDLVIGEEGEEALHLVEP